MVKSDEKWEAVFLQALDNKTTAQQQQQKINYFVSRLIFQSFLTV